MKNGFRGTALSSALTSSRVPRLEREAMRRRHLELSGPWTADRSISRAVRFFIRSSRTPLPTNLPPATRRPGLGAAAPDDQTRGFVDRELTIRSCSFFSPRTPQTGTGTCCVNAAALRAKAAMPKRVLVLGWVPWLWTKGHDVPASLNQGRELERMPLFD